MSIPTPHNAAQKGQIAQTVLMPGDPLRAEYIARNYLEDSVCFNTVRNMLGFTGTYKGTRLSVMGSGMGMPSMGIYSYELFTEYDVDRIIRVGSAGGYQDHLDVMDIVLAMGACTDSNYASVFGLPGTFAPTASFDLLQKAWNIATQQQIPVHVGNVISSDVFYQESSKGNDSWKKMGVLAVEMEAAALYMNAARTGKSALAILTISDLIYGSRELSAEERQIGFGKMIELALETAIMA